MTSTSGQDPINQPASGEMPNSEMEPTNPSAPVEEAIDRSVNRVLDAVVDQALAQLSDEQERELVRSSLTTVVRETLSEVAEKEVMRQMSLAPMATAAATTMGEAVNTGINAAKQVKELGFVEFTAGLINGTFDAIVGATIKQMDAYAKLVADLAKSLSQFQAENISEAQISAHLAERFPDGQGGTVVRADYTFTDTPANPSTGAPVKAGKDKLQEVVESLLVETRNLREPAKPLTRESLGITADATITKFTGEQVGKIRNALAQSLATSMIEHLRAMAREGMARIVITDGEIFTKLTFNVTATDEQDIRKSKYEQESAGAYIRASGGWGPVRVSAGASYSKLNVSAVNEGSFNSVNMTAEMIGQVKLKFKTESFPPITTQSNP